ncbi:expressed unknown protein [Seminavis robusta]|uniref:Uncharacterized protein n=1 Tax=Seminavis robusta TaxID=568900 RepID=A0A9N8D662_9STRA|nr:expressed unknown protein [Seminavis robusta]|eukprot:Sro14_g010760.1 n/a (196) ;mRNA; r:144586-145173
MTTSTSTSTKPSTMKQRSRSSGDLRGVVSCMKKTDDTRSLHIRQCAVGFDTMEVYEFPQILGDNPACTTGAPLTLDWKPVAQSSMLIDYYEFTRNPRRTKRKMLTSSDERHRYLLNNGVKLSDIEKTLLLIDQIKKDRASSLKTHKWDGFLNVVQNAAKKTVSYPTKLLTASSSSNASSNKTTDAKQANVGARTA